MLEVTCIGDILKKSSQYLKTKNNNGNKAYNANQNQNQKMALEATVNKLKLKLWLKIAQFYTLIPTVASIMGFSLYNASFLKQMLIDYLL